MVAVPLAADAGAAVVLVLLFVAALVVAATTELFPEPEQLHIEPKKANTSKRGSYW